MTGAEIRTAFLAFFAQRGHHVLPSSALVPDDPTTLFTTAGMQQFVPWFRREVTPPFGSVVTVQKCARTDDLDQVGHTARHHTFFEMLGNFSFGDYFKEATLRWGWEFATSAPSDGGLGLDPDCIWVTYYQPKPGEPYQEDLETKALWRAIGVPDARIIPLGKKENWWGPVGASGPCGPCSEMHYDRGAHLACGPDCTSPACGCDRWIEFWNHVFQQFNFQHGDYLPLPVPGIDTGAGLERIASLVQEVPSNYDTDLVAPLMGEICRLASLTPGTEHALALRVIADHLRCAGFMITDGVLPSNSKRGYVVRRIIRRAARFGRHLGLHGPFLYRLVPTLVEIMGTHYRELGDNATFVTNTLRAEEARFADTLERGEELLARLIADAHAQHKQVLDGHDVFTLYDTYGFPRELTEESALEAGLQIDEGGYQTALAAARERARAGGHFAYAASLALEPDLPATRFVGYEVLAAEGTLLYFQTADDNQSAVVVLDQTPFYATSGGQCADHGTLHFGTTALVVVDVTKDKYGHVLHTVDLTEHDGFVPGPHHTVGARVASARRDGIRRAHTATHLLHWALGETVGEHAKQAGSFVDDDYLRFDFTHPLALSADELTRIEDRMLDKILDDAPVVVREMSLEEARAAGFTALFGEKYGDHVRAVAIGGADDGAAFSRELCGGTHLARAGQTGLVKIIAESSVAAGVRRIEAYTGKRALVWVREQTELVRELASTCKVPADALPARLDGLQRELKDAYTQIGELKVKAAAGGGASGPAIDEINGIPALIAALDGVDAPTLAALADQHLNRLGRGVVALASVVEGKVVLAVKVSKELTPGIHAGTLIREMATLVGGGGGGRPDFAQAGGKDPAHVPAALQRVRELLAG
jgi:alanyl-tRNA synthetase